MAGIYVHIPFCKQACHYCNFHFSTNNSRKKDFVEALLKEITLRRDYLQNEEVQTIYFGGGTPSLLRVQEIDKIIKTISGNFRLGGDLEITLEVNPDDIASKDLGFLTDLRSTSVNRISIGIQSFDNEDLKFMNRSHCNEQALRAIENCLNSGYHNINADLIYGTPTLTDKNWEQNLYRLIDYGVPHISAYALTVEKKTALHTFIRNGTVKPIDETKVAAHFEMLVESLNNNKFIHYEISNFALKGFISRHNSNYWKSKNYLGLGPSAHSYNGNTRQWNVANNHRYIDQIAKNTPDFEIEILSLENKYNEYILTSLRTMWGVDLFYLMENFGKSIEKHFLKQVQKHIDNSISITDKNYILTNSGKLFADRIASDLFLN
ncbi:MAG TPA: radical SAM family heme chaperone HemW [Flavobacteriales bacterium]|nr:radical SAM family heme chaperone HemW [Flavobacteriales bacterium]HIN39833.1 radical SAM family heme chaperone HemW [Flavobacteriales bacterium]